MLGLSDFAYAIIFGIITSAGSAGVDGSDTQVTGPFCCDAWGIDVRID